jgi:hypothetical protein
LVFKKNEGQIEKIAIKEIKLSEKYRNVFSNEDANSFDKHTKSLRNEWSNI